MMLMKMDRAIAPREPIGEATPRYTGIVIERFRAPLAHIRGASQGVIEPPRCLEVPGDVGGVVEPGG